MSDIAVDMSKIDFRIVIDSDVKERFKAACKNLETPPSMSSEIEKFMNWFADCVEKTREKPKLSDISQGYHSDSHDIAVEGTNNGDERIFSVLEELKGSFKSLDNRLNNLNNRLDHVEKNSGIDPDYQPEILEPGHKLITFHLTQRLADYQKSIGKRPVGRGSLKVNRDQNKDNMNAHREWLKKRDPQELYWDWNEEEKIYTASVD